MTMSGHDKEKRKKRQVIRSDSFTKNEYYHYNNARVKFKVKMFEIKLYVNLIN